MQGNEIAALDPSQDADKVLTRSEFDLPFGFPINNIISLKNEAIDLDLSTLAARWDRLLRSSSPVNVSCFAPCAEERVA